jgi:hypothetical protein
MLKELLIAAAILTGNGVEGKVSYTPPAPEVKISMVSSRLPDCTWKPESLTSGGYNAYNPSGATGKYQIMPQTAAGYGCSLATPIGQERCAWKIYQREGTAPWVNC